MKSILHEQRRSSIAAAAVTVLLGVLLVAWPDRSIRFLCALLGAASCLTGGIYLLGWLRRRKEGYPVFFLLPGIILFALGLWLMTAPVSVVMLIQYIFGAILLFHGIVDLQSALSLLGKGLNHWWMDVLLSLLTAGLGVLVLLNPFGTFAALMTLIGAALVFDGLSDLYLIFRLNRAFRQAEDGDPDQ